MRGKSWILLQKDRISSIGGGGGAKHNRTDSCTETFCSEMGEGVIFASSFAKCKGGITKHNCTDSRTEVFY